MHSSEIAKAHFSTTKFREGYVMDDVDSYLDKVRTSLESWESGVPGELTADAVEQSRFALTKFRTGYVEDEVDNYLDEVSATLQSFEGSQHP
ncbi:DivIVA domain-containing protein [Arthrobacter sp. HY1533]|uniref:DivIVA domain-containing protein n=1 Tax=Arthrobacter sp. HY1533 TaxID=2970919 RepID=UPI0022BA054F|nr:DivIVA domain-containing protein [Arthrobacter sp. HY1533]